MTFDDIALKPNERPEDLFQRLTAFMEDNLLKRNGNITHHGEAVADDEEVTPSLENFIVLTWLRLVHSDLSRRVRQRYGTELRNRTLASIKPEISQALPSLLDEIRSCEEVKAMRSTASTPPRQPRANYLNQRQSRQKSCPLCKEAGRKDTHFLSKCTFLPEQDRKYMIKARQIAHILEEDNSDSEVDEAPIDSASVDIHTNRVSVR